MQSILKRVALLAVGVGLNSDAAVAGLATIPEDVLESLLSSDELDEMDATGRKRVVRLLARDERPSIRMHALEQAAHYERPLSNDTLVAFEWIAADPEPATRASFRERVAEIFDRLSVFDRTRLVARWTTSDSPHLRLAVARALQSRFVALGVSTAIQLLRDDPDDAVRAHASIAGVIRGTPTRDA